MPRGGAVVNRSRAAVIIVTKAMWLSSRTESRALSFPPHFGGRGTQCRDLFFVSKQKKKHIPLPLSQNRNHDVFVCAGSVNARCEEQPYFASSSESI
jgi:hypothetical protein